MSYMQIVEYMNKTPELWKRSDTRYKVREERKIAWKEMAKELNADVNSLKKNWNCLTTCYRKWHRRVRDGKIDESNVAWKYYKHMGFYGSRLRSAVRVTPKLHKQEIPPRIKKEKRKVREKDTKPRTNTTKPDKAIKNISNDKCTTDPEMLFLMSILPSMKKLTLLQNLQFRRNISKWLLDTHSQNLNKPTNPYITNNAHLQTMSSDVDSKENIVIQQIQ